MQTTTYIVTLNLNPCKFNACIHGGYATFVDHAVTNDQLCQYLKCNPGDVAGENGCSTIRSTSWVLISELHFGSHKFNCTIFSWLERFNAMSILPLAEPMTTYFTDAYICHSIHDKQHSLTRNIYSRMQWPWTLCPTITESPKWMPSPRVMITYFRLFQQRQTLSNHSKMWKK